MELRQLRVFVAVAEERHLGRAASRLYLTAQAVSKTLAVLEREAGGRLVERHPRGVELTAAGTLLYGQAVQLLVDADRTLASLRAHTAGEARRLRIGLFDGMTAAAELTPLILRAFREAHPQVRLFLHRLDYCSHFRALVKNEVDVALVRPPLFDERLLVRPLFEEPRVAALPERHRLAEADELAADDLLDETFVAQTPEMDDRWAAYWRLDALRGEPARSSLYVPRGVEDSLQIIALGDAYMTTPACVGRALPTPGVRIVPLPGVSGSTCAVARRRDTTDPLVYEFEAVAQQVVTENLALVPGARPLADPPLANIGVGE